MQSHKRKSQQAAARRATRAAARAAGGQNMPRSGKRAPRLEKRERDRERRMLKEEHRAALIKRRKEEKKAITPKMWAEPAPAHLVAALAKPKIMTKYQSYYEFADNPQKKDKKIEFQTHPDANNPPPGYAFVPHGDPLMTTTCKEISREQEALVFIVSTERRRPDTSKISEHVHRIGYHFRETIVNQARQMVGETVISNTLPQDLIEPIPETQEEINTQADSAIRDLFPKIPNIDRTMIIDHAFKKGGLFHGEPTVGLQTNIPLSRRVQLAVVAHIRHTHTRYDSLLRETSWMNARKVVEPVCLDFILKWRGDDETGRDQLDEILREVVIITDSESEEDSSEDDSSDEAGSDGEVTSVSSPEPLSAPNLQSQQRPLSHEPTARAEAELPPHVNDRATIVHDGPSSRLRPRKDTRPQKGFSRYQAAWEQAVNRRQEPSRRTSLQSAQDPFELPVNEKPRTRIQSQIATTASSTMLEPVNAHNSSMTFRHDSDDRRRYPAPKEDNVPYVSTFAPGFETLPRRDAVSVKPHSHHYEQHLAELPSYRRSYATSIVDHGSTSGALRYSTRHSLQDMLVESVETPSNQYHPQLSEQLRGHENAPVPYPRPVVEYPEQSARKPTVIVIDDSPPVRRRHVAQSHASSQVDPFQLRGRAFHAADLHSASHSRSDLPQASREFITRRSSPGSQVSLTRDLQNTYTDAVTGEVLPIYDAPSERHPHSHFGNTRPSDITYLPRQREASYNPQEVRSPQIAHGTEVMRSTRQTDNHWGGEREMQERELAQPIEGSYHNGPNSSRQMLPVYAGPSRLSHSYDPASTSKASGKGLIYAASQSGRDEYIPHDRDDFIVLAERAPRSHISHGSHPAMQAPPARSHAPPAQTPLSHAQWAPHLSVDRGRDLSVQPSQPPYGMSQRPIPVTQSASRQPDGSYSVPGPSTRQREVIFIE